MEPLRVVSEGFKKIFFFINSVLQELCLVRPKLYPNYKDTHSEKVKSVIGGLIAVLIGATPSKKRVMAQLTTH